MVHKQCRIMHKTTHSGCSVALLAPAYPEQVHQRRDQLVVNDGLYLLLGACSDVGDRPARLLLDGLLVIGSQQAEQALQSAAVDHHLQDNPKQPLFRRHRTATLDQHQQTNTKEPIHCWYDQQTRMLDLNRGARA